MIICLYGRIEITIHWLEVIFPWLHITWRIVVVHPSQLYFIGRICLFVWIGCFLWLVFFIVNFFSLFLRTLGICFLLLLLFILTGWLNIYLFLISRSIRYLLRQVQSFLFWAWEFLLLKFFDHCTSFKYRSITCLLIFILSQIDTMIFCYYLKLWMPNTTSLIIICLIHWLTVSSGPLKLATRLFF